jgi:hypothetical protein
LAERLPAAGWNGLEESGVTITNRKENTMTHEYYVDAIRLNLTIIGTHLHRAGRLVDEALGYLRDGNQNAAIGTLLELPDKLEASQALYGAILAIHRHAQ